MEKQTILIVDDDMKVVETIRYSIGKIGQEYEIKIASDGKEALDLIEKERIDMVLLDINMPVMSGAQLLTELCNRKIWMPIIILTGYSIGDIHSHLTNYGIIELLHKPLDIMTLQSRVKDVLKKKEHRDSISGLSLPAILQVIEMEQRTGVMTINSKNRNGRIFFKKGKIIDIEGGDINGIEALSEFISPANEDLKINIEYHTHNRKEKISGSLTEILLEASRLIDETNL